MMNRLDSVTIRSISSAQVITGIDSIIKELVENSLDAGATNIQVKLDNFGLERIEVRDNGEGIPRESAPYAAVPHYTTKLQCFEDLERIGTYGFRGEALGSLAAVSDLTIITCTANDALSTVYSFDHSGHVSREKPSSLGLGTSVVVTGLFQNIPVRRQLYKTGKKCRDEFKRVEDVLLAYGLSHPNVRIVLRHNSNLIWQKPQVEDLASSARTVFGFSLMEKLAYFEFEEEPGDSSPSEEESSNQKCRGEEYKENNLIELQNGEDECQLEEDDSMEENGKDKSDGCQREGCSVVEDDEDKLTHLLQRDKCQEDVRMIQKTPNLRSTEDKHSFKMYGFLPRPGSDPTSTSRSNHDRLFLFVNQRPVYIRSVVKVLRKVLQENNTLPISKFPVGCLFLFLPLRDVDVNVEPNKTSVFFKNSDGILRMVAESLTKFYTSHRSGVAPNGRESAETSDVVTTGETSTSDMAGGTREPDGVCMNGSRQNQQQQNAMEGVERAAFGNPQDDEMNSDWPQEQPPPSSTIPYQEQPPSNTTTLSEDRPLPSSTIQSEKQPPPSSTIQSEKQPPPSSTILSEDQSLSSSTTPPDGHPVKSFNDKPTPCTSGVTQPHQQTGVSVPNSSSHDSIPVDSASKWSMGWTTGSGNHAPLMSASLLPFGVAQRNENSDVRNGIEGVTGRNGNVDVTDQNDTANVTKQNGRMDCTDRNGTGNTVGGVRPSIQTTLLRNELNIGCSQSSVPSFSTIGSGNDKKRRPDAVSQVASQRKRPKAIANSLQCFWKQLSTADCSQTIVDTEEERHVLKWNCEDVTIHLQAKEAILRSESEISELSTVVGSVEDGKLWFLCSRGDIFAYYPQTSETSLHRAQVLREFRVESVSENPPRVHKLHTVLASATV